MGGLTREKWLNRVDFCRHFVGAGYHGFQVDIRFQVVNGLFGESRIREGFCHFQLDSVAWKWLIVRCGYLWTPTPYCIHLVRCCYCCLLLWFLPSFSLCFTLFGSCHFLPTLSPVSNNISQFVFNEYCT